MDSQYYQGYLLDDLHAWEIDANEREMFDACIFIVDNKCTIRNASLNCGISKSSLHRWIHSRLPKYSFELYNVVKSVLAFNLTKSIGGVNFAKYRKPKNTRHIKRRRHSYQGQRK